MTTKKTSHPVDVEAGRSYSWCGCGLSPTLPLCDKTHLCTAQPPVRPPLTFLAEQSVTVFLCTCTRTENAPYCDGFNCDP
ncbi:CDGSH iron-sulfur domain-containing protein [Methylovulum psychrotolerans]|uniref:Glutamate synthase n=1 Tax=Methylovulum psychrotolerans TaxID=1704499 RepID=A0A1Z4BXE8_9GAMM|nr:glutamate synthase [Methylovulum psychrotolerans]ASF45929.1 glutamate synthase [Methylovulum psychrotolerans]